MATKFTFKKWSGGKVGCGVRDPPTSQTNIYKKKLDLCPVLDQFFSGHFYLRRELKVSLSFMLAAKFDLSQA